MTSARTSKLIVNEEDWLVESFEEAKADFFGVTTSKDAPQVIVHIYGAASKAHKDEITSIVNDHQA